MSEVLEKLKTAPASFVKANKKKPTAQSALQRLMCAVSKMARSPGESLTTGTGTSVHGSTAGESDFLSALVMRLREVIGQVYAVQVSIGEIRATRYKGI